MLLCERTIDLKFVFIAPLRAECLEAWVNLPLKEVGRHKYRQWESFGPMLLVQLPAVDAGDASCELHLTKYWKIQIVATSSIIKDLLSTYEVPTLTW